jgi:LysM repeat protein
MRRWAAPVGVLAALTIAVVLVHNGLSSGGSGGPAGTTSGPTTHTATTVARSRPKHAPTTTNAASAQYYVVQSGDTFGSIAAKYGTTVAQLEALNPGVSSTALSVGQKVRVK